MLYSYLSASGKWRYFSCLGTKVQWPMPCLFMSLKLTKEVRMLTKEVGISISPLVTVSIWECEQCHRQWSDTGRNECPYCTSSGEEHRWDDINECGKAR
jgi:hypothetical protein